MIGFIFILLVALLMYFILSETITIRHSATKNIIRLLFDIVQPEHAKEKEADPKENKIISIFHSPAK